MRYTTAILIKFIMKTAVLWFVFSLFYGVNFGDIIVTSIILTAIAFAADVFILPRIGNMLAATGDFALAFFGIWFLGSFLFEGIIPLMMASFLAALIIAIGELVYHRYLRNSVFTNVDHDSGLPRQANLQTEASEELDPEIKNKK